MKKLIVASFIVFPFCGMAQKRLFFVKKEVYPLNDNDSMFCYYFPVKNNIADRSLPYYKENPTLDDIVRVATTMPCDSFVVKRDGRTLLTINLHKDSTWNFSVREKMSGKDTTFSSELIGAMTEHRSIELINNGYDKNAGQVFGKFNFNQQQIPYITTKNLEGAVLKIVDYFLYTGKRK
ncbi:MAG: hypothetical protein QM610_11060 [Chitinophagaceae bacterium]